MAIKWNWIGLFALALPVLVLPVLSARADNVAGQGGLKLSFPLACELGKSCFVQSYVDLDETAGEQDFACGSATYDGHDGTDFRVLSAHEAGAGVDVLAAADGVVKGMRDGMADELFKPEDRPLIAGRECGNGVVIDHGGGFETQYCHMKQASVVVKSGDKIARGQTLGEVGYSGMAQFAHLHLTVRENGVVIDPFLAGPRSQACARDAARARGLWDETLPTNFMYANGEIIASGFSGGVPQLETPETDGVAAPASAQSPQLLFYARFINLKGGDKIRLTISGPEGFNDTTLSEPLGRNKANYLAYSGKKLKTERWPPGVYKGTVDVVRDDRSIASSGAELELK